MRKIKGKYVEPTTPGIYVYDGGQQQLAFALDKGGAWWVWSKGYQGTKECAWEYIEQALDIYNLVLVEEAS